MKVVMANDHGGRDLAAKFLDLLKNDGADVTYLGTDSSASVDYTDKAAECVAEYKKGGYDFGIVLCGTGIGISIAANKHHGIVCALPQNLFAAKMAREHNDANFVAFGGRIDYADDPCQMLLEFLHTRASDDERHIRRRKKLKELES